MTIKYEWFLPFVLPFVFLGIGMLLFWVAGVPFTKDGREFGAATSLFVGANIGGIFVFECVFGGKTLGSFTIGKKGADNE